MVTSLYLGSLIIQHVLFKIIILIHNYERRPLCRDETVFPVRYLTLISEIRRGVEEDKQRDDGVLGA